MRQRTLVGWLGAILVGIPSTVLGQGRSTERTVGEDRSASSAPPVDGNEQALYLRSPGHYLLLPSEGPGDWSPHYRPFPDYSQLRQPRFIRPLPSNRLGGSFGYSFNRFGGYYRGNGFYGGYSPYIGNLEGAYNQGRYDADHEYLWYLASQRAGRLLNQYSAMFDEGMSLFHQGDYERAAVKFLGAAAANHANAASRLHAGHAMFALGRYGEGVKLLERAFELSPSLAYKTYDVRDEYASRADFDEHLAGLKAWITANPSDAGAITMLGYVRFFTEGPGESYSALARASGLNPQSYFIPKLLEIARQARPADAARPASKPATSPRGGVIRGARSIPRLVAVASS